MANQPRLYSNEALKVSAAHPGILFVRDRLVISVRSLTPCRSHRDNTDLLLIGYWDQHSTEQSKNRTSFLGETAYSVGLSKASIVLSFYKTEALFGNDFKCTSTDFPIVSNDTYTERTCFNRLLMGPKES